MAAYAAVVSLMNTIDQIEDHPCPPISFEKEQVESLGENINFLLDFLESYSHVAGDLETRIADAAYAAEDIIESYIADRILSISIGIEKIISFIAQVQKVIEYMDFIKNEVVQFKEKIGVHDQQPHKSSSVSAGSLRSSSTGQNNTMVGLDDVLYEVMDKLIGGQPNRQIIPIVGMGGIRKTTLAKNIYQNKVVVEHFDILVWITISQEYRIREILLELVQEGGENMRQMNEYELGDKLYKKLSGRRYLIIMDDVWDIKAGIN